MLTVAVRLQAEDAAATTTAAIHSIIGVNDSDQGVAALNAINYSSATFENTIGQSSVLTDILNCSPKTPTTKSSVPDQLLSKQKAAVGGLPCEASLMNTSSTTLDQQAYQVAHHQLHIMLTVL